MIAYGDQGKDTFESTKDYVKDKKVLADAIQKLKEKIEQFYGKKLR